MKELEEWMKLAIEGKVVASEVALFNHYRSIGKYSAQPRSRTEQFTKLRVRWFREGVEVARNLLKEKLITEKTCRCVNGYDFSNAYFNIRDGWKGVVPCQHTLIKED